jgi:hypothetical protein
MTERESLQELEARLLNAARAERAPAATRARVRAAVGLAAGAGALAATGSAAALTTAGLLKFAVIGVAGGLLAVGIARYSAEPAPTKPPQAPPAVASAGPSASASARPAPQVEIVASARASAKALPPSPPPTSAPAPAESSAPSLGIELAVLDEARTALRAHDAAGCLRVLDRYDRQFPVGQMAAEAMVMRIDALVQSGNRPAASQLAKAFSKANPRSPLLARVRALAPEAIP